MTGRLLQRIVLSMVMLSMLFPGVPLTGSAQAQQEVDGLQLLSLPVVAAQSPDGEIYPSRWSGPTSQPAGMDRLVFEVAVPLPTVESATVEGRIFQRLSLPGYQAVGRPGQPEVLQQGLLVGIPAAGDVSVRVLEARMEELPGSFVLIPVFERIVDSEEASGKLDLSLPLVGTFPQAGLKLRFAWDEQAYSQDSFQPAELVAVDEIALLRQQRVARLAIQPVQYNPASGVVRVARNLRVEVTFSGAEAALAGQTDQPDVFESLLRSQLFNYEQARAWRVPRQAELPAEAPALASPGDNPQLWLKTVIPQSGLYKITPADLRDAGRSELLSVNPRRLQVWYEDQQIPADFLGDGDIVFEDGEMLLFYAHVPFSIYHRAAVYWVTVGNSAGLRMGAVDGSPAGVAPQSSFPATMHLEEDLVYRNEIPLRGDPGYPRWYGKELSNLFIPELTLQADLPRAVVGGYTATLRLRMVGVTEIYSANPDHKVAIELNGHPLGELIWDGAQPAIQSFDFPSDWLAAGENQIRLSLPGGLPGVSLERAFLDWIEIGYRQSDPLFSDVAIFDVDGNGVRQIELTGFHSRDILVYDISDSATPAKVSNVHVNSAVGAPAEAVGIAPLASAGLPNRLFLPAIAMNAAPGSHALSFRTASGDTRRFAVSSRASLHPIRPLAVDTPSTLASSENQADYLLITHGDFLPAAQVLAAHRQATGLNVAVIDVQDVYDEFSGGQVDPNAIRDFVDFAYQNWQSPAPAYLLLLGDGHYDYRMLTGLAPYENFIPPYYGCFDPWLCEVASDNEFVTISGNDRLPDLMVGRLPAYDLDSANRMVNKVVQYETNPPAGDWHEAITFVADNPVSAQGQPDPAGNFQSMAENIIDMLPAEYAADRIYYDPWSADDNGEPFRYRTVEQTTQAIIDAVDDGRLLVNYIGHAGNNVWAHEWLLVGQGRRRDDVQFMTNGGKLPIFLDMACLSGNFADPTYKSMQEVLLDRVGGGSVGGWAATGFGVATGHDKLHEGFYDAVFVEGESEVGQATVAGKLHLWDAWGIYFADLLDTFGYLGDPAMQISLPARR